jgi:hypothetical protein
MGDQDVEIRFKRAVFLDGSMVIVHRMNHIVGDKPKIELIMELSQFMVRFTNTDKRELFYDPNAYMPQSTEGFVKREYDASSLQVLSDNPEFPVILMCCTFKGDPPNIKSPNMAVLIDQVNTILTQDKTIASLRRSISVLEDELNELRMAKTRKEDNMTASDFLNIIKGMNNKDVKL